MEQNKLLNKPFKQLFHITDIKHNIIGIPFFTKYITTIKKSDSKINIKNKYTRMQNTEHSSKERSNNHHSFQSFTPSILKKENIINHSQDTFTNFRLNKFTNTTKVKADNIYICLTLNLDQFTKFFE